MPAAIPLLATIGGGSALAGGATLAMGAGALYNASKDRGIAKDNQNMIENTQAANQQQRAESLGYIQNQAQQAQDYLGGAFKPAQQSMNTGYGNAMQALSGAFPQQMGAITQGSQDAQRFTLGALPYIQQALMGQPMDFSQMTPYVQKSQIQFDPNFMTNFANQYGRQ